jgi:methylenetetrahydrofolate reductase (NADPH)
VAKVIEHLQNSQGTIFSIEILPPVKGQSIEKLFKDIMPLIEFQPKFIDVTYHREEFVYRKTESGLLKKHVIHKRPGTVGICAAIENRFNIDTVPHIICGGFTKEETENALIDLAFLGIDNVLVLRGDAIKNEPTFKPEPGGNNYATDLLQQVVNMNQGRYLDESTENPFKTDFCIGVAGYPEKHFEAPNLDLDMKYLKMKQDLGADYVVTQMFFDNEKYFEFVDQARKAGITIPIIPGLKPLTTKKQVQVLPRIFSMDIPSDLAETVSKCKNNEHARMAGVEWCIMQSKELMAKGVPCLHYYSMSKSKAVAEVARAVF